MRDVSPRFPDPYGDGIDLARTNYIPVHVGGVQVGWKHPDTGVYTPAVRCDPPGQPISGLPKPILRDGWDR